MDNSYKMILIGGASGVGKSTLIYSIDRQFNFFHFSRKEAFKEMAIIKGIDISSMYDLIDPLDVDRYLIKKCMEKKCMILDCHFAVQYNRDKKHVLRDCDKKKHDIDYSEEYVGTISEEFIDLAISNGIILFFILLEANSFVLYQRQQLRLSETGRSGRGKSIDDISNQLSAEFKMWNDLPDNKTYKLLVNAEKNQDEVFNEVMNFII